MGAKIGIGRLYSSRKKLVFVASDPDHNGCPTINLTGLAGSAKLRDDFTKGLKIKKSFAKLIFK